MIENLMSKIQEAKALIDASKEKLNDVIIEESCGGVSVQLSAARSVKDITISAELMADGDAEQISDLLVIALNKALEKGKSMEDDTMKTSAMGMLPGLGL